MHLANPTPFQKRYLGENEGQTLIYNLNDKK